MTISDSDTLRFSVNWDTNKLIVGEDYYAYPGKESGVCYRESYEIQKDDDGHFTMAINRRNNIRDEQAVFYILNDKGKFVIKTLLPIAASNN